MKGCNAGIPRAQFQFGQFLESIHAGEDTEKNVAEALRWYAKAAEQGYAPAQARCTLFDHFRPRVREAFRPPFEPPFQCLLIFFCLCACGTACSA